MSFFTSVESHRKKLIARLNALDASNDNIALFEAPTSKKELNRRFEKYIDMKFNFLLNENLAKRKCLANTINPDCPCDFKPTEAPQLSGEELDKAIKAAREALKKEQKNPPQKTDCEADILHHLTNYLIRMNADYIPTDEKEQICKVLLKLFDALDASPENRIDAVNTLLETNKSLYGTRTLHVVNTAILVIGLAVLTAGLLLMLTGFGFPIGVAVYAIAGVTMAAGAAGMIGGTIGVGKHSYSGSVVPSGMRDAAEKLNPRSPGSK